MLNSKYWTEYHNKKMTAEEALSHIKTGDVIGTSQCGVDPKTLLETCPVYQDICSSQHYSGEEAQDE